MCKKHYSTTGYHQKIEGRSGNEIISRLIYELTGQITDRKKVSSHIQVLKKIMRHRVIMTEQQTDSDQISGEVEETAPAASFETPNTAWAPIPYFRRKHLSKLTETLSSQTLSLHNSTTFGQDFLSLSFVSRIYRIECLAYLALIIYTSNLPVNLIGSDDPELLRLSDIAAAETLYSMGHLQATLIEGYMDPWLSPPPTIHTLSIRLLPRNPIYCSNSTTDRVWGPQTEALLASLGVTMGAKAKIRLEMRWEDDCARFEREYVETGRWRRISADDGRDSDDKARIPPAEGFYRRRYELCGNGETVAGVERDEEVTMRKDERWQEALPFPPHLLAPPFIPPPAPSFSSSF